MNGICLVVDRLHAGYVGAYGNSWIETPAIDQLACESFLFDNMLIDSPRLETLYRSYWLGRHAGCAEAPVAAGATLPGLLGRVGVDSTLLTDEPILARCPLAAEFDELVELDAPAVGTPAREVELTHLAGCFTRIIDWLEAGPREPFMLWCHLSGMAGPWDAPGEFRRRYAEPGDPPPPEFVETPAMVLEPDFDPDLLLGITQAYAGQVSLLDTCIGALLEYISGSRLASDTLLVLLSARGFPLGEHHRVGECGVSPYGELLHVPLLVRMPDRLGAAGRSQSLVEPADVWLTLLDIWRAGAHASPTGTSLMPVIRGGREPIRNRLCPLGADGRRAIRTPAWHMLADNDRPELFAKPDDRWEANNVASRCHDVVERLTVALDQYEEHLASGRISELPPLDDILLTGLD